MTEEDPIRYQALYHSNCRSKKEAIDLLDHYCQNPQEYVDPHQFIHYALIAKYGGESFSAKQAFEAVQIVPSAVHDVIKPGETFKSELERMIEFRLIHKII